MVNCKPIMTPMSHNLNLCKRSTSVEDLKRPYCSLVGRLLYITMATRPDLTFTVCYLARFSAGYDNTHWDALLRVLHYLQGTASLTIQYSRDKTVSAKVNGHMAGPLAYVDANWASNRLDQKSVSGYVFIIAGGPISWSSKGQITVALSSTEAEYMSLSEGVKQALYLNKLRRPLGLDTKEPTVIKIDNQSAIATAYAPGNTYSARMKHLDVRLHHIRDQISDGTIQLVYCPTEIMAADVLTKALAGPIHRKMIELLNLSGSDLPDSNEKHE